MKHCFVPAALRKLLRDHCGSLASQLSELKALLRRSDLSSSALTMLRVKSDWDEFLGSSAAAASAHAGMSETLHKSGTECLVCIAEGAKLGILALQQASKAL